MALLLADDRRSSSEGVGYGCNPTKETEQTLASGSEAAKGAECVSPGWMYGGLIVADSVAGANASTTPVRGNGRGMASKPSTEPSGGMKTGMAVRSTPTYA